MTENYFVSNDIGILNNHIHDQAEKIKRLEAQVKAAHKILASESFGWLVIGSEHEVAHWKRISPDIDYYWDKYGTYFRPKPAN